MDSTDMASDELYTQAMNEVSDNSSLILAVDIERVNNSIIAIGACLMRRSDGILLQTFKTVGFFPHLAGGRDYHDFWMGTSGTRLTLDSFVYDGNLSFEERQREMIQGFMAFRLTAEELAMHKGVPLAFVVDSTTDVTFLSMMIMQHIDRDGYLPYSASSVPSTVYVSGRGHTVAVNQRSFDGGCLFITGSMQHQLLSMVDPHYCMSSGRTARIREIYGIPAPNVLHDHDPMNDAITIAHEYKALMDIACGRYKMV